jgi:hypothetical protein
MTPFSPSSSAEAAGRASFEKPAVPAIAPSKSALHPASNVTVRLDLSSPHVVAVARAYGDTTFVEGRK